LKVILVHIFLVCSLSVLAQNDSNELQFYKISNELQYGYKKPKLFDVATNIPKNYRDLGIGLTKKNNLLWVGLTIASTGLLIPSDQDLIGHEKIYQQT